MKKMFFLLTMFIGFAIVAQPQKPAQMSDPTQKKMEMKKDCNKEHCKDMKKDCNKGDCNMMKHDKGEYSMLQEKLPEQEKQKFIDYKKALRESVKPLKNELDLRKAELKYLIQGKNPNITEIEKKTDEVKDLEKKIQLERIKFGIKIKKEFAGYL